ncbi:hypothetical protein P9112_006362 [Eukaryota sp. TZLM1-RC]
MQQKTIYLFGKYVSLSTIRRVIINAGYTHKVATKLVKHCKRRLIENFENLFTNLIGTVVHSQLLFIDELSFRQEQFCRKTGWSPEGEPVIIPVKQMNAMHISLVVCINQWSYVTGHMKEGHFNRHEFIGFSKDIIESGITHRFPGNRSVLVLDGCRIHTGPEIFHAVRKVG